MSRLIAILTREGRWFWPVLFAATWLVSTYGRDAARAIDARWLVKYPAAWRLPLKGEISTAMDWLVEEANFGLFTFRELTRGISWLIEIPYDFARSALIEGFERGQGSNAVEIAPSLSWIAVIVAVVAMGHYARN